jgi:hypothetical protein
VARHLLRFTQQHLAEELLHLTQQHLAEELSRLTQQHLAEELHHLIVRFSLLISNSPPVLFLNLLPLAITTLEKKPLVTTMLILRNYTISNNKEKIKFATIEEGDDIVAVTFFATKPQKKGKFAISLQQSKEGGGSCRLLLLRYKVAAFFAMLHGKKNKSKTKEEEGDGNCHRLLRDVALQRSFRREKRR